MTQPAERAGFRWLNVARVYVVLAVVQFAVISALAMVNYPGADPFDTSKRGYSFWHNTLCDLGKLHMPNDELNPVWSRVFSASMVMAMSAFGPMWLVLPRLLPSQRRLGQAVLVLGLISLAGAVAVGLTPADTMVLGHSIALSCASVPGLAALTLAVKGLLHEKAVRWPMKAFSLLFLALAMAHFWQFISHFWMGLPWMPIEPATQKVAAIVGLTWMGVVAVLAKPVGQKDDAETPGRKNAEP